MTPQSSAASAQTMLNKVPAVTIYFWIIKILCTTVGETGADYLNETLGFGLTNTSLIMAGVLAVVLAIQFRAREYRAPVYWLAVVFISVVGTLITDNLTDHLGVPLIATTIAFSIALGATFAIWYRSEKTLSIHTITTTRRESFYWLAILFTFALGTAAGDLVAEQLGVGYLPSIFLFGGMIAAIVAAHAIKRLGPVAAFWFVYILTRPLGASIGDFLTQSVGDGGLGFGPTNTTIVFMCGILGLVAYLTISRVDHVGPGLAPARVPSDDRG